MSGSTFRLSNEQLAFLLISVRDFLTGNACFFLLIESQFLMIDSSLQTDSWY